MGKLTACLDCGELISPSAAYCPKCHTDHPRGVTCSACGTEAIPKKDTVKGGIGSRYYHAECVKRILTIPDDYLCPDCNLQINQVWDWQKLNDAILLIDPCPNCGLPNLLESKSRKHSSFCGTCTLHLLDFHNIVNAYGKSYHDLCVPESVKQKQQSDLASKQMPKQKESNVGCAVLLLSIVIGGLLLILK